MFKILSCNIRCFGADDGLDSWAHRKNRCVDVIRSQNADIICFQEMWAEQHADLHAAFPDYDWHGMIDEPVGNRPMNAIFYRRDAYRRLSTGGYWLSETPHVPGTKAWDSNCVRLANWIRLEDVATHQEFRVVNTHLDHIGQTARENQARLIVEDAAGYPPEYPQFLTGDMNCDSSNPAIQCFKDGNWIDTYEAAHGSEYKGHTFHRFLGADYQGDVDKMDWVFMRGNVQVTAATVITEARDGRYPSDHYFVSATVHLVPPAGAR